LHRVSGRDERLRAGACGLAVPNALYRIVSRRERAARAGETPIAQPVPEAVQPVGREGGFALVVRDRYLRLMAVMLLVATVINTTGEYVGGRVARDQRHALPPEARDASIRGV